jgi:hypothetical protein
MIGGFLGDLSNHDWGFMGDLSNHDWGFGDSWEICHIMIGVFPSLKLNKI